MIARGGGTRKHALLDRLPRVQAGTAPKRVRRPVHDCGAPGGTRKHALLDRLPRVEPARPQEVVVPHGIEPAITKRKSRGATASWGEEVAALLHEPVSVEELR